MTRKFSRSSSRYRATLACLVSLTALPFVGLAIPAAATTPHTSAPLEWIEPDHSAKALLEHEDALSQGYVHEWLDPTTFPPPRPRLPLLMPVRAHFGTDDKSALQLVQSVPAALNYFFLTGDDGPLEAITMGNCPTCTHFLDPLQADSTADAYVISDPITITGAKVVTNLTRYGFGDSATTIVATVNLPQSDRFVPSTSLHVQTPPRTEQWLFVIDQYSDVHTQFLEYMGPYQP